MAQLNELMEYLYGNTPEVRIHGLQEIGNLFMRSDSVVTADICCQLGRTLCRIFGDHYMAVDGEGLLSLSVMSIMLMRPEARSLPIMDEAARSVSNCLESSQVVNHECSGHLCLSCRTVHVGLVFLFRLTNCEQHLPTLVVLSGLAGKTKNAVTREAILRSICCLTKMKDRHDSFLNTNTTEILESYTESESRDIAMTCLYNLSFDSRFLRKFDWSIHWKCLPDPQSVRILINGLQSGVYELLDRPKDTALSEVMQFIVRDEIKTDQVFFLQSILNKMSKEEKESFVKNFKYELFQFLLFCLHGRNCELTRCLLLLPTSWLRDKKSIILDRIHDPAIADSEDMMFALAGLCKEHVPNLRDEFPHVGMWADDRYVEKALRSCNARQLEKVVFSLNLSGKKLSFSSLASITNNEYKTFLASSACEDSKEVRDLIKRAKFQSWKRM